MSKQAKTSGRAKGERMVEEEKGKRPEGLNGTLAYFAITQLNSKQGKWHNIEA